MCLNALCFKSSVSELVMVLVWRIIVFFFNDTATTEIYTLSLHDALPICLLLSSARMRCTSSTMAAVATLWLNRSEEHTSELQSQSNIVCRLLLEKKKHIIHLKYSHIMPK